MGKFNDYLVECTTYEYVDIVLQERGKRTNIYVVRSRSSGEELARIRWHGPWRQYWIEPADDTGWSIGCLSDVIDFLKILMHKRLMD